MNTKEKIKQYLDANVHDGEDRKGCHCDKAVFSPDELQELVEEACEYALKEEEGQAKSYAELGGVEGWRVNNRHEVVLDQSLEITRIIWATKEQAEASKAVARLSNLMAAANEGWEPNWTRHDQDKFVILFHGAALTNNLSWVERRFLAFKTKELRDEFLELHRDLIMQARPLL